MTKISTIASFATFLLATSLVEATKLRGQMVRLLEDAQGNNNNNETLADDIFEIPDDFRDGEELKDDAKDGLQTLGLVLIIAAFVGVVLLGVACCCLGGALGCGAGGCLGCCSASGSDNEEEDEGEADGDGVEKGEESDGDNNNTSSSKDGSDNANANDKAEN